MSGDRTAKGETLFEVETLARSENINFACLILSAKPSTWDNMKEKPAGFEIFRVERGQTAVGTGRCSCHRYLSEAHEKPELHFLFFISPKEGLEPPINSISVAAECSRCGWDGKQESRKEKKERGVQQGQGAAATTLPRERNKQ